MSQSSYSLHILILSVVSLDLNSPRKQIPEHVDEVIAEEERLALSVGCTITRSGVLNQIL